jgi:hypothetical protein
MLFGWRDEEKCLRKDCTSEELRKTERDKDTQVKTGTTTDYQSRYIDYDIVSFHVEGAISMPQPRS